MSILNWIKCMLTSEVLDTLDILYVIKMDWNDEFWVSFDPVVGLFFFVFDDHVEVSVDDVDSE